MKHLTLPDCTDVANLCVLARNRRLSSYPDLATHSRSILKSYCSYRRARGNAKSPHAPAPLHLPITLKDSLKAHYSFPPNAIEAFITNFRKCGSPDVCPMCGSPKSGELDHLFPKDDFPEFSVYGYNLVPACDCNTKRGTTLTGLGAEDRVLHPYFDELLTQRLVRAQIEVSPEFGYTAPTISLCILIPENVAGYGAVKFHVDNVLRRTDVLAHFDVTWPKIFGRPDDYFRLSPGHITRELLQDAIRDTLARTDRHFGTPNNWDSMLFAGLEANADAGNCLYQHLQELRGGLVAPVWG